MVARDDLTGTNWSKIPVSLIEMGFLSNPSEDRKMQKSNFQTKMAKGIADGIDAYFK
ncbi:MAG: N-acetylmuramoyl-L-alanine amidase family protein [Butyribacter sp.]